MVVSVAVIFGMLIFWILLSNLLSTAATASFVFRFRPSARAAATPEAYCIAAVGDISTYSGYPVTTPLFTVTTASFPAVDTSIPTASSDPGFVYTPTYLPTAPDTLTNCQRYANYDNTTYNLNSCKWVAWMNEVTTADFLDWNPSLNTNLSLCAMQPGYSYCAILNSSYTTGSDDTSSSDSGLGSLCLSLNATESTTVSNCNCFTGVNGYDKGAPTQTGYIYGCQEFFTVESGDDCSTMKTEFGVSLAQLYEWNPSIGKTCTNIWLRHAYCVKGPTAMASSSAGAPTQPGIASNCNEYYTVVSGDSCTAVEGAFEITFAQLYEWNPVIGSDCQYLDVGYAICVGVS
ncbi:hypothetical protein N7537_010946 [Penicillium hordei]|uniref:LysM domain-containing protein n=1 Tax=Penicillium hordei TaxID=40994 RepID=A0AAD6GSA6_9EURO|nr:uncharacterized protein N7537_010946 [Penicillium hordei]KAJ5588268.1 hypothetical protein N7537_010946 [Penicillium hordei]